MRVLVLTVFTVLQATYHSALAAKCRNVPGDPGFPSKAEWAALNSSVSGHLVAVVPSAKFCRSLPAGACTDQQWESAQFRNNIPGAMNRVNLESDWESTPPSLCLRNGTTCEQGNTPLFAVLAESVSDIQAGVKFARAHNLRLVIKASGHDYLGRSTAKHSLLISTQRLKNITFSENFMVGSRNKGSVVTLGSGVGLREMYQASGAVGKLAVGGSASTVVAAGGYVQGAGHSSMSPYLGLVADNCHELKVVLADGRLVTVNEEENPDLFWAMRGGGPGSWGVIVSATFQTFPTFNVSISTMIIPTSSVKMMGDVITTHARHIFSWDSLHVGQYFFFNKNPASPKIDVIVRTFFPKLSPERARASLASFITEVEALGTNVTHDVIFSNINEALVQPDDPSGTNFVFGSRLIDASAYRKPTLIGQTYVDLVNAGAVNIYGIMVAGGKVSQNANISSAVNPKWRTAKTHLIIENGWTDLTPIPEVRKIERTFQDKQLPILQKIAPPGSGSYLNEADRLERDFRTTFYGPNYGRLSEIKAQYDPTDLFIVTAGVGSERWDEYGICRV